MQTKVEKVAVCAFIISLDAADLEGQGWRQTSASDGERSFVCEKPTPVSDTLLISVSG